MARKIKEDSLKTKSQNIKVKDNSFLVVKVGSDDRPASVDDIKKVQADLKKLLGNKFPGLPVIVTFHAIEFELFTL